MPSNDAEKSEVLLFHIIPSFSKMEKYIVWLWAFCCCCSVGYLFQSSWPSYSMDNKPPPQSPGFHIQMCALYCGQPYFSAGLQGSRLPSYSYAIWNTYFPGFWCKARMRLRAMHWLGDTLAQNWQALIPRTTLWMKVVLHPSPWAYVLAGEYGATYRY